ncbi:MAG: hypothetical protein ACTSVW_02625 [Candidatus Njordarchaeales archaeon]
MKSKLTLLWERSGLGPASFGIGASDVNDDDMIEVIFDNGLGDVFLLDNIGTILKKNKLLERKSMDIKIRRNPVNGRKEIYIAHEPNKISKVSSDLELIWSVELSSIPLMLIEGDINGDNLREIGAITAMGTVEFLKNESYVLRIPLAHPIINVSLIDINGDGQDDIVAVYAQKRLSIFSYDENELPNKYKVLRDFSIRDSIIYATMCDLEGEERKKLLVATDIGEILQYNFREGNFKRILKTQAVLKSLAIGDIDGNGENEIIISGTRKGKSVIFIATKRGGIIFMKELKGEISRPKLGDIDGDKRPEIIFTDFGPHIYALDPINVELYELKVNETIIRIITEDINADGKDEILAKTVSGILAIGLT